MSERENMLIQNQDLNGSMQNSTASNNLLLDMKNQLRTNELRIDVLQKQNDSLKVSLEKLRTSNIYTSLPSVLEEPNIDRRIPHENETLSTVKFEFFYP